MNGELEGICKEASHLPAGIAEDTKCLVRVAAAVVTIRTKDLPNGSRNRFFLKRFAWPCLGCYQIVSVKKESL
jgi:hypothetical protein